MSTRSLAVTAALLVVFSAAGASARPVATSIEREDEKLYVAPSATFLDQLGTVGVCEAGLGCVQFGTNATDDRVRIRLVDATSERVAGIVWQRRPGAPPTSRVTALATLCSESGALHIPWPGQPVFVGILGGRCDNGLPSTPTTGTATASFWTSD